MPEFVSLSHERYVIIVTAHWLHLTVRFGRQLRQRSLWSILTLCVRSKAGRRESTLQPCRQSSRQMPVQRSVHELHGILDQETPTPHGVITVRGSVEPEGFENRPAGPTIVFQQLTNRDGKIQCGLRSGRQAAQRPARGYTVRHHRLMDVT